MYFCTQYGKILELQTKEQKNIGTCSCGFTTSLPEIIFAQPKEKEARGEGIVKETLAAGFPHTCKKCGRGECDVVDLRPFFADESNIYLYRCKKCKFIERQADGTGNT